MIDIIKISKRFSALEIFRDFDLCIRRGAITTILGPSGTGKTTLLNLLAGVDQPDAGTISINPGSGVGYVLQDSILLPWRTLRQNIRLGHELGGRDLKGVETTIAGYLDRFGLGGFEDYFPAGLSGGMRQRASLIRTLITEPEVLLLDEPFSNLDFDIKIRIQLEMLAYQQEHQATFILVTHDIEDAIALSDEIILLSGRPAAVKERITVQERHEKKDPVHARSSPEFPALFAAIWEKLKS